MNKPKLVAAILLSVVGASTIGALASPLGMDSSASADANFYDIEIESDHKHSNGNKLTSTNLETLASSADKKPARSDNDDDAKQSGAEPTSTGDKDDIAMHISLNNPEFRLIGPERTALRMRDDMQTKIMVAVENLRKDAGDLWGSLSDTFGKTWQEARGSMDKQLETVSQTVGKSWTDVRENLDKGLSVANERIDKTWTDLRSMVEKQLSSAPKKTGQAGGETNSDLY